MMSNSAKYQQAGNTFFILDNRDNNELYHDCFFIKHTAQENNVDGIIILQQSSVADYRMLFYNNDASRASMCGNGIASLARYIYDNIENKNKISIESDAGIKHLLVDGKNVTLKTFLIDITDIQLDIPIDNHTVHFINSGVPHCVIYENIDDITEIAQKLRNHRRFAPHGCNVNFVNIDDNIAYIRTYERGVEGETQACGTGVLASAIITNIKYNIPMPIDFKTASGSILTVNKENQYITLTGSPEKID